MTPFPILYAICALYIGAAWLEHNDMPKFSVDEIVQKKSAPVKGVIGNVMNRNDGSQSRYGITWDDGSYTVELESDLKRPGSEPIRFYKNMK